MVNSWDISYKPQDIRDERLQKNFNHKSISTILKLHLNKIKQFHRNIKVSNWVETAKAVEICSDADILDWIDEAVRMLLFSVFPNTPKDHKITFICCWQIVACRTMTDRLLCMSQENGSAILWGLYLAGNEVTNTLRNCKLTWERFMNSNEGTDLKDEFLLMFQHDISDVMQYVDIWSK